MAIICTPDIVIPCHGLAGLNGLPGSAASAFPRRHLPVTLPVFPGLWGRGSPKGISSEGHFTWLLLNTTQLLIRFSQWRCISASVESGYAPRPLTKHVVIIADMMGYVNDCNAACATLIAARDDVTQPQHFTDNINCRVFSGGMVLGLFVLDAVGTVEPI